MRIVVETNFRVYAYCSSSLQVELLSLFTAILYRLPNLAVGVITRESVRSALKSGIGASQIIHFLASHARAGNDAVASAATTTMATTCLPFNVRDQILLWESERRRVHSERGVFFDDFGDRDHTGRRLFEAAERYASDLGARLWSDAPRQLLVVRESALDEMRAFFKRHA